VADLSHLPGALEHALAVRPIEQFIEGWDRARSRLMAKEGGRIVMVGAGAAGVELALSMQRALETGAAKLDFTIVSAADTLPGSVGKRLFRILRERRIHVLGNTMAQRIEAGKVIHPHGTLEADLIIVSTGAAPAEWPRASGIKTDERGFILVNDKMQSLSHAEIFAAGDCASMSGFPRPKSGVYAVRAGPPLEQNLRRALAGEPLQTYLPQVRSLYLISTGDRYAVGSWGGLSWEGAWAWRWKDRIDRQFVARYR
jgi:selenide,water dikinase